MDEEGQERRRRDLLRELYGPDVPANVGGQLLRTVDVAHLFQVSERTVSEWARQGRIPSVRTPGGHRRYPADEVRRLLETAEEGYQPAPKGDPSTDQTWPNRTTSAEVTNLAARRSLAG